MFFAIPRAQSWEIVLVNCGHGVTNDASNQDNIIPVFQEGAISGVVRATCSGGLGDFVPEVFCLSQILNHGGDHVVEFVSFEDG